jgi:AmiR/NasT family two-component response regulator
MLQMHKLRIVIADDEPIILLDLRQMLEELGMSVVGEASDGVQAVEKVRALKPDLAILDVKMPRNGRHRGGARVARGAARARDSADRL